MIDKYIYMNDTIELVLCNICNVIEYKRDGDFMYFVDCINDNNINIFVKKYDYDNTTGFNKIIFEICGFYGNLIISNKYHCVNVNIECDSIIELNVFHKIIISSFDKLIDSDVVDAE